jgi:A/G-specific adenine glycosylase
MMVAPGEARIFRRELLAWYHQNARDLPWRRSRDPYPVWISEIMLQQTRVAAVIEYYNRFMEQFPTIEALAGASEVSVLAMWSGLGYYRRARMMHRAAQILVAEHQGRFPASSVQLRQLPGIGEYTSAAVASICFGERLAVLDGNVERVLLRLGCEAAQTAQAANLRNTAQQLLDPNHPGFFNQAMMELGATVCTPRAPSCTECPVRKYCCTQGEHATGPAKQMRSKQVAYALIRKNFWPQAEILMTQRTESEPIMPGMWELPAVASETLDPESGLLSVRHSITNTNYYVTIYSLDPEQRKLLATPKGSLRWVSSRELRSLPLTGLTRKVLKRLKIMPGYTGPGPALMLEAVGSGD